MVTIYSILIFLIGLALGSFLNVVIFRIDELSTILYDRSHCPKCKKVLAWYDLIPFLSYILLKAKCRYCNEKISMQYPLVEIGTALLYLFLYLAFGLSYSLLFYIIVFSLLMVVFVYDIKTQTVPEVFVWIALGLSLVGGWYFGNLTFLNSVVGGIIAGGFLGALVFFSKEKWMGAGDIKLGIILGLLTGYPLVLVALFAAFVFGSIAGIALILYKFGAVNGKSLKTEMPFTPFLILGMLCALIFGQQIIYWYMHLFITM